MNWEKLKNDIYYLDGSLRDIYVLNTDRNDWAKWSEYVNANYKVAFFFEENNIQKSIDKINIEEVFRTWDGDVDYICHASIFLGNILVKAHFFIEEEIENDINPTEINSMQEHLSLVSYMTEISKALNKKVVLTSENYTTKKEVLLSI